jgi:hypothetical protein
VAFSPDGTLLLLGSGDGTASIVDVASSERVQHLQGFHSKAIASVGFSSDGRLLVLGSDDKTASIVHVQSGQRVYHLRGLHTSKICSVAFSSKGLQTDSDGSRTDLERRLAEMPARQASLQQSQEQFLTDQKRKLRVFRQNQESALREFQQQQEREREQHGLQLEHQRLELELEIELVTQQLQELLLPLPESPMVNRSFATSEFKLAYAVATMPQGAMDLGIALGELLKGYCQAHGIDWQGEGEPFLQRLQAEALHNLDDPIDQLMQRMWTSAQQLRGREFCFIFNDALRSDLATLATSVAALARGVNTLCVSVPPSGPFPPDDVCFRGGGFDDRYRDFFAPRRHFRIPSYFATSFSQAVADRFLLRSTMPKKVRWVVRTQRCVHVNLVTKRVPGLPDEQEYLFAPYSSFTVRSAEWRAGSDAEPHIIELVAAADNKAEPEDLPLAPWS